MDSVYESVSILNDVDPLVVNNLISKTFNSFQCVVCQDIMYVPFSLQCGHTFCYDCLLEWFKKKPNCPTCRHDIEEIPIINVPLRDIISSYIDTAVIINPSVETDIRKAREAASETYNNDLQMNSLFQDSLRSTALTIIDTSDGVPRCGNCHWEAHGTQCLHCGVRFRIPRDDAYYDSEDGHNYEDDSDANVYEDGENDYDSDSSFIDNGDVEVTGAYDAYDLPPESDEGDFEDHQDPETWEGFGDGNDSSDGDLERAMAGFQRSYNNRVFLDSDDEEHETELQVSRHGPSRILSDSDDSGY